jgi:hypothetical protein
MVVQLEAHNLAAGTFELSAIVQRLEQHPGQMSLMAETQQTRKSPPPGLRQGTRSPPAPKRRGRTHLKASPGAQSSTLSLHPARLSSRPSGTSPRFPPLWRRPPVNRVGAKGSPSPGRRKTPSHGGGDHSGGTAPAEHGGAVAPGAMKTPGGEHWG